MDGLAGGRLVALAAAASRTARASPSGRSRRWCACAPASSRARRPRLGAREASRVARQRFVVDDEERRFVEPRIASPARARGRPGSGEGGALRRLARLLRADGRAGARRSRLRGPPVGRLRAASSSSGTCSSGRATVPIFVLTLARPGAADAADPGVRARATLTRRPLPRAALEQAMEELLDGFVPGLPPDLRDRILDRAEGVPLLRGRDGPDAARPRAPRPRTRVSTGSTGEVAELEVPETLQASSPPGSTGYPPRSGVSPGRVGARQDLHEGVARRAVSGLSEAELDPLLAASCARRCSASRPTRAHPSVGSTGSSRTSSGVSPTRRSPGATARRATSPRPRTSSGASAHAEQEIVEVVAAHYLAAYEAAARRRRRGRDQDARARAPRPSRRARGIARRTRTRRAAPTSRRRSSRTSRWRELFSSSWRAGRPWATPSSRRPSGPCAQLSSSSSRRASTRAAARVSGRLGDLEVQTGRGEQGMRRMEEAFAAVSADEPDDDMAYLAGRLGRSMALAGELERAAEANELALGVAQALRLPETLVRALGTKAYLARAADRPEEELALTRHALRYALENDLAEQSAHTSTRNLSDSCFGRRPVRRGARGCSARPSLSPGEAENAQPSCSCSARRPTR